MTIRAYTSTGQHLLGSAITWTWAGLQNGDTGNPVVVSEALGPWLAACNSGTLGTGGTLRWEGSINGGTAWFTLSSDAGAALNQTAFGLTTVKERPLMVRPNAVAGDGTTNLTAILVTRR